MQAARVRSKRRDHRVRRSPSTCGTLWVCSALQSDQREANVAGKDKGGRNSKTPAAKSKKEKRQAKRDKRAGKSLDGPVIT